MANNKGTTSLKAARRSGNAMAEYDRLPPHLRAWVAQGKLPWRSKSVIAAYKRALGANGNVEDALAELDRLQNRLVAKDAARIWGQHHPDAERNAG